MLLVGAAAGNGDAGADDVTADKDAGAHHAEQFADAAAVERHVDDGLVFDELAHGGGFGIEQRGGAGDLNGFGDLADGDGEIEADDAAEFDG